jgi:transcriptional regulator with XRE-family HTH domain
MPVVKKIRTNGGSRFHISGFGEYFASLIESSAYESQEEIAHVLGVSKRTITYYLSNARTPEVPMCEAIAFAFGVSIAEVRAAAGRPLPTSIDSVFDKDIRSLMLGMDWTPERLETLRDFLSNMEYEQEAQLEQALLSSQGSQDVSDGLGP